MKTIVLSLMSSVIAATATSWWFMHQRQDEANTQEAMVDARIEWFLRERPREFYDATVLAAKQVAQELESVKQEQQRAAIARAYAEEGAPVLGDANAPVTMVMFSDYQCGYCRASHPDVKELLDAGLMRLIVRELPVLGPDSMHAARAALAVHELWPNRYEDFQDVLFKGKKGEQWDFAALAEQLQLDGDSLQAKLNQAATLDVQLARNSQLASQLSISGTPAFVIGGQVHTGRLSQEKMRELIARASQEG